MRRLVPITSLLLLLSAAILSQVLLPELVARLRQREALAQAEAVRAREAKRQQELAEAQQRADIAAREWQANFDELINARPAWIDQPWLHPPLRGPSTEDRLNIDRALIVDDDESWEKAFADRRIAGLLLVQALDDKQNEVVNRAALGLARLRYEEAIPELIDHLATKHKYIVQPGFGGGGPKQFESRQQNDGVRHALILLTGKDHGFDKDAWKKSYVESRTPKDINLRRRP